MTDGHQTNRPRGVADSGRRWRTGAGIGAALLLGVVLAQVGNASPAEDWPHFLGPTRDGVALAGSVQPWEGDAPPVLWRREVGEGYAGPVIADGVLVLFHRLGDREVVEGLVADTGVGLWSVDYPTSYRDDFGFGKGPRSAPTIEGHRVFTFGAQGVLQSLDLHSGELLWRVDMHERFRVPKGYFGAAGSPLLAEGRLLVNVGGPDGAGIVAVDADTGEFVWKATDDEASYSSAVLTTLAGRERALFFTRNGLVDLDPATGNVAATLRWRSRSQASVNAAAPLVIGEQLFLSACYGTGAVLLDVDGSDYAPVWSSDSVLSTHYATAIHHDGVLYGFDGALHLGPPALSAIDLATGRQLWRVERYGGGAMLRAGDLLLIQRDDGRLVLARPDRDSYAPIAEARILLSETRAYPALAGGVWYARSEDELVAVDLR